MSKPKNTINPAEPYEDLLAKYLPGVQIEVRDCWAMYAFDPEQLARLIEHVEGIVRRERNGNDAGNDNDNDATGAA
jgi:hypothetical protein